MRRRDEAVGKAIKTQRRKTLKRRNTAKAARRRKASVDANERIALLTRERDEAQERQTATAEVLKVISRSSVDLDSVLDTLVQTVARLCRADQVYMFHLRHDLWHLIADYGLSAETSEFFETHPFTPGRGSTSGRAALERRAVLIPDVLQDPEYTLSEGQEIAGYRTTLSIPLLREDTLIGVYSIARTRVEPFTDKEIELATSFASQAVIAIENARLLNELRQRTDDLSEALEQQTATSEVLKVISSSPGELEPIFDAMLTNATRICRATTGTLYLYEGTQFRGVATHHSEQSYVDYWRHNSVVELKKHPGVPLDRLATTKRVVHIPDLRSDQSYLKRTGRIVALVEVAGVRSVVLVPMIKEGELVGVINLYRQEVRPFTDKQIELVQNFAAQAVIAIENTRLLNELRQRTTDLTESLEELRATQDRLVQTEKLASLGQLTAGIAHEIKNPLNFVNNFSGVSTELIDELQDVLSSLSIDHKARAEIKELTDTLRGNLDKVVQHGKRADAIVKNMLLHSREGSGEHRPVDINAIVEESLNLAWHGARAEKQGFNITLEKSFDPTAGEADVFPQEITRALLNLISNGFYAAMKRKTQANNDAYEPTLAASTRSLGDHVEICIRDNGTGIRPDVKQRLFTPFFTTKPAGEGTGLGLSISHDIIVKQHGGSIEVDTQPGEFTEFRIILPRTAATIAKLGERA
ncbi:MAG: GAF domain-containing protein [Burkholderiales bacterium]